MAGLRRVTADLAEYRKRLEGSLRAARAAQSVGDGALTELADFGENPGNLRMLSYVPARLPEDAPLVVALHGCTQTAGGYDHGTGWSTLADRYGFALLAPEQRRANNPNGCFNWFLPTHARRDRGEARSIRDMVAAMIHDHDLDERRVFVTGLSAGGAMASVMLAAYPDVFAGGAIIAGLPYGAATNVQQAFDSMNGAKPRPAREWGYLVRRASRHKGPWPRVSVWHGGADATVQPMNAGEIIKQWTDLHGLPLYPSEADEVDGHQHRVWRGVDGEALIESHTIAGMAHGTPIAPGERDEECGAAAPFILDVGISSSFHIAKFWGLTETRMQAVPPRPRISPSRPGQQRAAREHDGHDPQAVIERALRSAGLMKR